MMMRKMTPYMSVLVCSGLLLTLFTGNRILHLSAAEETRFAYFLETVTGKFIKVGQKNHQVVAHGSLSENERLRGLLPEFIRHELLYQVLYESGSRRLYLIALKDVPSPNSLGRVQLLVLQLPTFELVGAIHEKDIVEIVGPTEIFLSQDTKRLLFVYQKRQSEKRLVWVSELYDTATLEMLKSQKTEVQEEWYKLGRFSGNGYHGLDLTSIYEGEIQTGEQYARSFEPSRDFQLPLEVRRLVEKSPSTLSVVPFNKGTKKVVLWERTMREVVHRYKGKEQPIEEKQQREYSTGRFLVYDQLRLAGDYPKVVTVSPEGRTLYFALGNDRLYAIDLVSGKRPVQIETLGIDVMFAVCIFADR